MLCLEFQDYFSCNFCPLVLGSVLTSEVTGIGLTFFTLSYILYPPQAAFAGCRRVVTGAVFLFHASPVQPDPKAAPAKLGWEQSIAHPCAGVAQFHEQAVSAFAPGEWQRFACLVTWGGCCPAQRGHCHCNSHANDRAARQGWGVVLPHGDRVSSPAVSWGLCCAIQSQVWLLMSSPNALSWYALFCVFPAVLLQALARSPAARTAAAGPPRQGTCWPRSCVRAPTAPTGQQGPGATWGCSGCPPQDRAMSSSSALPWAQPSWPVQDTPSSHRVQRVVDAVSTALLPVSSTLP